jgi:ATP-dependent Lon protease
VLVPEQNKEDVSELPSDVVDGLTIHFVKHLSDVAKLALVKE